MIHFRRKLFSAHQWQEQLDACGIDPATLPRRYLSRGSHSAHSSRERSRGTGKGKKGDKREGKQQRPQGAGPGTAVTGGLQKVEILNARCGVGRIRQAAVAACCPFA